MFCPYCGKKVGEEHKFCLNCGSALRVSETPENVNTEPEAVTKKQSDEGGFDDPVGIEREEAGNEPESVQIVPEINRVNPDPPVSSAPKKKSGVTIVSVIGLLLGSALLFLALSGSLPVPVTETEYNVEIVDGDYIVNSYGAGIYEKGLVTVQAVPELGHGFKGWYDDDWRLLSTEETYTFNARNITLHPVGSENIELTIYSMIGVEKVTGEGTYAPGTKAHLTATMSEGYKFKGWYSITQGKVVSTQADGYVAVDSAGMMVALSDSDRYSGDEIMRVTPSSGYDSCCWVVLDHWTHKYVYSTCESKSLYLKIAPGHYYVWVGGIVDGKWKTETFDKMVDGEMKINFDYTEKGKSYGKVWTVDYSSIEELYARDVNRHPGYDNMASFVECDEVTKQMAKLLLDDTKGMDDVARANFVLHFVQKVITYELDSSYIGKSDYWKYPRETMFDGRGDCEDSTILYCAIMKSMGYDVVMLLYLGDEYVDKGHAAAGVALQSVPGGSYYEHNGKHFYFCETTSGKNVGDLWGGYNSARIIDIV